MIILLAAIGFLLCGIAGFAKSIMDTIVFYGNTGFTNWKMKDWLLRHGTTAAEKTWDGWHVMQMIWHLAYGIGFFLFGLAAFAHFGWSWLLLPAFVGAWAIRLIAHYLGFSLTYPVR